MVATAAIAPAINFNEIWERKMTQEHSSENYTKISNAFLDEIMCQIESVSELKVVVAIFRLTAGYQKRSDLISYSQFQKLTGLTPSSVSDGLKLALAHGLVERQPVGQRWSYSLKPLAPGYRLEDTTTSPRLVVPLAPGERFDEKPLAPGYTPKKRIQKENLKKERGGEIAASDEAASPIDNQVIKPIFEKDPKPSSRQVEVQPAVPNQEGRPEAGGEASPKQHNPPVPRPVPKPQPKRAALSAREPDPTLQDPRLKTWRRYADLAGYGPWPNGLQRQMILETVKEEPKHLDRWDKVLKYWVGHDWQVKNVEGLLEVFVNGVKKRGN
jgi:phage replication O-like protein O